MSRRKQSNPKPLKREDDDWVSDAEGEKIRAEASTVGDDAGTTTRTPTPTLTPTVTPTPTPTPPSASITESPPPPKNRTEEVPRLRLKAGLATDPALRLPSGITAEFLAALPSALAASPYFCLPTPTSTPTPTQAPVHKTDTVQVPVYMCTPCGIRFSSLSTLEAHQTYYCSHRPKAAKGRADNSDSEEGKSMCSDMTEATQNDGDGAAKPLRTGKQYACPHCSYSADKKVSLNRHMRMHATSPGSGSEPVQPPSPHLVDRYCQDCDIRFSSAKTLRGHKLHYCGTRRKQKQGAVHPAPAPSPKEQSYLALPTSPVVLVPLTMLQGASMLPALAAMAHNTACILLPDGSMQPTKQAKSHQIKASPLRNIDSSLPLDLSMRRSPISVSSEAGDLVVDLDSDEDEKENRRNELSEEIICAPSLPLSSTSSTPSPISPALSSSSLTNAKRPRSSDSCCRPGSCGHRSQTSPHNGIVHNGLKRRYSITDGSRDASSPEDPNKPQNLKVAKLSGAPSHDMAIPPQVLVKQGVSKCQECNIVFCLHDNYIAHKKHYCSARTETNSESEGKGPSPVMPGHSPVPLTPTGKDAKSPSPVPAAIPVKPPVTLYQFICAACGIKFTSLDNLTAHQAYYCPKRAENKEDCKPTGIVTFSRRCVKCKTVSAGTEAHTCGGWKCLCCDVVSATASAAQRHMDSHSGVKAFRCTICRYKGNTLRGMRTHIRMHFEKKATDLQEENFISCVVGDEEPMSPVPAMPAPAPSTSPDTDGSRNERLHFCDHCNYSSTYKGNVVRHHKLVHSPGKDDDQPPGEHDDSASQEMIKREEDDVAPLTPEPVDVTNIKTEPVACSDSEHENSSGSIHTMENSAHLLSESLVKKTGKYCKFCNISFAYLSNFIVHKKFYCLGEKRQTPTEAPVVH